MKMALKVVGGLFALRIAALAFGVEGRVPVMDDVIALFLSGCRWVMGVVQRFVEPRYTA